MNLKHRDNCILVKYIPDNGEASGYFEEETGKLDKPAEIKEKILDGKMNSYFKERILLQQPYVKNQDITVGDYLKETVQKFGENIEITRFARFTI